MQALAAANTLDKTLAEVLSPTQQAAYQQEQADEKAARAESSATSQVDNLMPLLQLTDEQKEKAVTALYQQQTTAADPASLMTNPNPLGTLARQGQSVAAAMKQVLTPDQYTLYQQDTQLQAQAFGNFGGGGGGRNRGNNGGNGGGQAQAPGANGGNPAVPGYQVVPNGTTTGFTSATSNAMTTTTNYAYVPAGTPAPATDPNATTNAASATTNSASATPPAPAAN